MGLLGILIALALLMWLAYRGWSVLLLAPASALLAAAISGEPLLAHWTQTFMGGAARFVAQWFPMFLLGGLFGKLMDDSGSITSIARFLTEKLGTRRTMLAVVIASAVVTYGGVSVFVAFFVLVPMAQEMFRAAASARPSHHMPKAMVMIAEVMPRPGAAKVVVPKKGIGMALLTEGDPGSADMVNVNAPRPMVAGINRRGMSAARNISCAIGTRTKKATKTLTPP